MHDRDRSREFMAQQLRDAWCAGMTCLEGCTTLHITWNPEIQKHFNLWDQHADTKLGGLLIVAHLTRIARA